jgi:hypothetical protein
MNWSADARYLSFLRRGSDPAILRIPIADGMIEQVTDLAGVRQTGFRSGFWMDLTPDDSPLILRDVGTEESSPSILRLSSQIGIVHRS